VGELLRKAARCYALAGWTPDAVRAFERMGDHDRAAAGYEQMGRGDDAARAYSRAGRWEAAARCWLRIDRAAAAADCLRKTGQTIEAAWLLADRAGRFREASEMVREDATDRTPFDRIAVELVRARCDVGRRPDQARGVRRLREITAALTGLADGNRARLFDRAFAVAGALGRPDIAADLHAAAVLARLPRAAEQWDRWAERRLGCRVGVEPPAIDGEPGRERSGDGE
jgi:hypothetical protein